MKKIKGEASLRALAILTAVMLAASAPASAAATMNNTQAVTAGAPYDGFIVKFREGTVEKGDVRMVTAAVSNLSAQVRASGLLKTDPNARAYNAFALQHKRRLAVGADLVHSSTRLTPAQAIEVMHRLAQLPGVEYVEPDMIMQPTLVPNDTSYSQQWSLTSTTAGIRVAEAWDKTNGAGITIAVLDTGMTMHYDLQANLVPGYDFISDPARARDGNGRDPVPSDQGDWLVANQCASGSEARNSSWHGTHVAGIAAAVGNNVDGIIGVAYGAKIMPVRVLGACGGLTSDITDAIVWAAGGTVYGVPSLTPGAEAKVINMSLGAFGACQKSYQTAIDSAIYRGATIVVSAGNDTIDAMGKQPASCKGVITVASTTATGVRSSFSNYGSLIDLAAPGSNILSTLYSGPTTPNWQTYGNYSGTSMATPHVSGTVALMQSRRLALGLPLLEPHDVELLLKRTAYPFPIGCGGCGSGILDASAAVEAAANAPTKLSEHTDQSGKIKVAIFARTSLSAKSQFVDFAIEVPDDYVVIGGGGEAKDTFRGNMLAASYPNAALTAWMVSSKDHQGYDPVQLKGWAIGLKIAGLSRQQVRDAITVTSQNSSIGPKPATTLEVSNVLIGGGFRVNVSNYGQLGVSTYPVSPTKWGVQSKEHMVSSPTMVTGYAIGIRNYIEGVGWLRNSLQYSRSGTAAHPAAQASVQAGFALTSCGANGLYDGFNAGRLLWKIMPTDVNGFPACHVSSKDHFISSHGQIDAVAIGLQAY